MRLCQTATGMADTRTNQVLRSTRQTEILRGPGGYRVNAERDGTTRLLLSQWPITGVSGIRIAPSVPLPYQFTPVQAGNWAVERLPLLTTSSSVAADSGTGGQAVILGPCGVTWGRRWVIETTYDAGWPHAGIAASASAGDGILDVDDCTGWAPDPGDQGAVGVIQDTTGTQEAITCLASSVPTGPGTLILAGPLQYAHDAGVLVTCLPSQIQWAAALYAGSQALTRGSTSTTVQTARGGTQRSTGGGAALKMQADELLCPFRRMI